MARAKIPTVDELMRMKLPELRQWTKAARDTANRRISRLEADELQRKSLAYRGLKDRYGVQETDRGGLRFRSTGATDINRARAEAVSVRQFLTYQTSTISGTRAYRENVREIVGDEVMANDQIEDAFWDALDRFRDIDYGVSMDSSRLIAYAREIVEDGASADADALYNRLVLVIGDAEKERLEYDPFAFGTEDGEDTEDPFRL